MGSPKPSLEPSIESSIPVPTEQGYALDANGYLLEPTEVAAEPRVPPPRSAPPSPTLYEHYRWVCDQVGWECAVGPLAGVQLRKLKEIMASGFSDADVVACIRWMRADAFWGAHPFDLKNVAGQMVKWREAQKTPPLQRMTLREMYELIADDGDDPANPWLRGED